jgi:outer membrane protein OmpA-like peptidoglycan-associated protein
MTSKLGRALAGAALAAALVAAAIWLPGASADQPAPKREHVSDTFGNVTRTIVTGQCLRTTYPHAGTAFPECGPAVETAKAAAPPVPAPAPTAPAVVATPKPVEPAPAPPPQPVAQAEPAPAPAAPAEPAVAPAASADEDVAAAQAEAEASADSRYDQEIAAAEEALEPEPQAEAAPAPAHEPEPPAEVAEAHAPEAPPETSVAPPSPPAPPQPRKLQLAADTQFHFDRAQLTPSGQAELDRLIAEMGTAQIGTITIVGYTDRIGTDAYNQKLSERRADSVKQYLVGRNVEADRVQAFGRGKNDPVTTPATCKGLRGQRLIKCLAPDRRVEVEVVGLVSPAR